MIGGDFYIIRNQSEKNNEWYNKRRPFLFNAIIDGLNLRELGMSGRKFTWANSARAQHMRNLIERWSIRNGSNIFL